MVGPRGVAVAVALGLALGVKVIVGGLVCVSVGLAVNVAVGVKVKVGVNVGVAVCVGDGVLVAGRLVGGIKVKVSVRVGDSIGKLGLAEGLGVGLVCLGSSMMVGIVWPLITNGVALASGRRVCVGLGSASSPLVTR